jgi:hypothetical protein
MLSLEKPISLKRTGAAPFSISPHELAVVGVLGYGDNACIVFFINSQPCE